MIEKIPNETTSSLVWSERVQSFFIYTLFDWNDDGGRDDDDTEKLLITINNQPSGKILVPLSDYKTCERWISALGSSSFSSKNPMDDGGGDKLLKYILSRVQDENQRRGFALFKLKNLQQRIMKKFFCRKLFSFPTIFWLYLHCIFSNVNPSVVSNSIETPNQTASTTEQPSAMFIEFGTSTGYDETKNMEIAFNSRQDLARCRIWFSWMLRIFLMTHDFFVPQHLQQQVKLNNECINYTTNASFVEEYTALCRYFINDEYDSSSSDNVSWNVNLQLWCPHSIELKFTCDKFRRLEIVFATASSSSSSSSWTFLDQHDNPTAIVLTKTFCVPHYYGIDGNNIKTILYGLFFNRLYTNTNVTNDLRFLRETNFLSGRRRAPTVHVLRENYTIWDVVPALMINNCEIQNGASFTFDFEPTVLTTLKNHLMHKKKQHIHQKQHQSFEYTLFDTTRTCKSIYITQWMGAFNCSPFECGFFKKASDPNNFCIVVRYPEAAQSLVTGSTFDRQQHQKTFTSPCAGFLFLKGDANDEVVSFSIAFKNIFQITINI